MHTEARFNNYTYDLIIVFQITSQFNDFKQQFCYKNITILEQKLNNMISKSNWTEEEDQFLRNLQGKQEKRNWVEISEKLNERFPHKFRSSKQCRQRFINHSSLSKQCQKVFLWKEQQKEKLLEFFLEKGPKWTQIAKNFIGKTQNSTKNKFYSIIRKTTREINDVGTKVLNKKHKKIKYQALLRIIHAAQSIKTLSIQLRQKSILVTQKLISISKSSNNETKDQEIMQLIKEINKFNLDSRNYKQQKYKITPAFSNSKNQEKFQKQDELQDQNIFQKCSYRKSSSSFMEVQDLVMQQKITDIQLCDLFSKSQLSPGPYQLQSTIKWNEVLFDEDMINNKINQQKGKMKPHFDLLYFDGSN